MATHCSIFAWRIPWTEKPGRLHSGGCKELDMTKYVHTTTCIVTGERGDCEKGRGTDLV